METTTNLGLKKPAETEFYDVNDFNENADKIDAAVSQLETAIAARAMGVYNEGFIGGLNAALLSTGGAAVGAGAKASKGLAGGKNASAAEGAAIGSEASASHGVAAGRHAKTLHGAALGDGAKTVDEEGNPITAVQLGEGTNSDPNTFQVFSYQMMDANGQIPRDRITAASNGFFVQKELPEVTDVFKLKPGIYAPYFGAGSNLPEIGIGTVPGVGGLGIVLIVGPESSGGGDIYKNLYLIVSSFDLNGPDYTCVWACEIVDTTGTGESWGTDMPWKKIHDSRGASYSTTPQPIGTWIDGRPVYRQAFQQEFDGYSVQVFLQNADNDLKVVVLSARCNLKNSLNDTYIWTDYAIGGGGSTSAYIEFAGSSKPSGATTAYGYVDYIIES